MDFFFSVPPSLPRAAFYSFSGFSLLYLVFLTIWNSGAITNFPFYFFFLLFLHWATFGSLSKLSGRRCRVGQEDLSSPFP